MPKTVARSTILWHLFCNRAAASPPFIYQQGRQPGKVCQDSPLACLVHCPSQQKQSNGSSVLDVALSHRAAAHQQLTSESDPLAPCRNAFGPPDLNFHRTDRVCGKNLQRHGVACAFEFHDDLPRMHRHVHALCHVIRM